MSDTHDADLEVLRRITDTPEPSLWPLGTWLQHGERPGDRAALAPLDPFMDYPGGGRRPLFLPGWDDRSVWGFDPPDDAYFAQLWRNSSTSQGPDIWICGRGHVEGREFVVTTTHLLAREIAAATGAGLAAVCRAMLGIDPGSLSADVLDSGGFRLDADQRAHGFSMFRDPFITVGPPLYRRAARRVDSSVRSGDRAVTAFGIAAALPAVGTYPVIDVR